MNINATLFPISISKRTNLVKLLYILFTWISTAYTLYFYQPLLKSFITPSGIERELLIAGGQIVFLGLFLIKEEQQRISKYLINLMSISLLGSIALWPILIASFVIKINPFVALIYFILVATSMFFEHYRRVKILLLPSYLCLIWAVYRLTLLIIIL